MKKNDNGTKETKTSNDLRNNEMKFGNNESEKNQIENANAISIKEEIYEKNFLEKLNNLKESPILQESQNKSNEGNNKGLFEKKNENSPKISNIAEQFEKKDQEKNNFNASNVIHNQENEINSETQNKVTEKKDSPKEFSNLSIETEIKPIMNTEREEKLLNRKAEFEKKMKATKKCLADYKKDMNKNVTTQNEETQSAKPREIKSESYKKPLEETKESEFKQNAHHPLISHYIRTSAGKMIKESIADRVSILEKVLGGSSQVLINH